MKKVAIILAYMMCVTFMSGCSAFSIYQEGGENSYELKGVPFYKKIGKYKKTTIITRTWLEVTFVLETLDSKKKEVLSKEEKTVYISPDSLSELAFSAGVKMLESKDSSQLPNVEKAIELFFTSKTAKNIERLSSKEIYEESMINAKHSEHLKQSTISRNFELISVVDYSHLLYFNSKIPVFGTANATIKLAGDGTLTEGVSSVDNTKSADLIPIKEYAEKVLGIPSPGIKAVPLPPKRITINAIENGYKYILTKEYDLDAKDISPTKPLSFEESTGVIRQKIGDGEEKSDDKETIGITGKVKLPPKLLD